MDSPKTLVEWGEYVQQLTDERLVTESRAANTLSFVDTMTDEGYSPEDIVSIFRMFGGELKARDFQLPNRGAGVLDYYDLMLES